MRYQHLFSFVLLALSMNANALDIKIDGKLSADEWQNAQVFDLEYEIRPSRNTPAKLQTTAYLKYDKKYLYIGFKAYGDPKKIRATLRNRDSSWREDYVALMADPYGDGRYGILIGVNALGSQLDEKHISSAEPDDSWNVLFQSSTSFDVDGYTAELAIPFSELQFPKAGVQKWKIGFMRKSFEAGLETVFASFQNLPREMCYACQADEDVFLGSPEEINRNYLYPYIFLNQNGDRAKKDFKLQNPDYAIGISGLFDLTKSSSLEYTINPDFSQIESDVPVIMANETFAVSYPEKRTFFLEGAELLKSDLQSIYTRSISDPIGAIKYINQGDKSSTYFLQATDTNSPYLAAGDYKSYSGNAGKSKITIGRMKRNLPTNSYIGFILTNRDYHLGGSGSLVEIDSLINFLDDYTFDFNVAQSNTQEGYINFLDTSNTFAGRTYAMDGESFSGTAKKIRLRRVTDGMWAGVKFKEVSPTYRSNVGFVGKNNYKEKNYWYGRSFKSQGTIRDFRVSIMNHLRSNFKDQKTKEFYKIELNLETDFNLKLASELKVKPSETFKDQQYGNQKGLEIRGSYHPSENFYIRFRFESGEAIAYNEDNPLIGDQEEYQIKNVLRFSDNFKITFDHRYSELTNKTTKEEFYAGEINRFEVDYQFDNALSARVIVEKNDFSDDYYLEGLVQWKPNPYTIFYAGGTQYYEEPNPFSDNLRLETSQLYLKFQYFYNPNS